MVLAVDISTQKQGSGKEQVNKSPTLSQSSKANKSKKGERGKEQAGSQTKTAAGTLLLHGAQRQPDREWVLPGWR